MIFELSPRVVTYGGNLGEAWEWQATVKGEVVAVGPVRYNTEKEARSGIAAARKAFQGARFAKVVVNEA